MNATNNCPHCQKILAMDIETVPSHHYWEPPAEGWKRCPGSGEKLLRVIEVSDDWRRGEERLVTTEESR